MDYVVEFQLFIVVTCATTFLAIEIHLIFLRMQRNKGQFTSAKKSDGGALVWGSAQEAGQEENPSETSWVYLYFYRFITSCIHSINLNLIRCIFIFPCLYFEGNFLSSY